jgi:ABC-type antimicrobial peptide transport system permease subunit
VNEKITDLRYRRTLELLKDDPEALKEYQEGKKTPFMLRPLTDIHLHSYFGYAYSMGDILYIYIFSTIAIFILLLACINFMNLATARSVNRAKEIGLRKVVGANKRNLIAQFYGESILMAFIGLFFAMILIIFLLPGFSVLADKQFSTSTIFSVDFIAGIIGVTFLTGIISGSYPAIFLSSFQPIKILRSKINSKDNNALFRKILVVFQFSISMILIVGTLIIYSQLHYMKEKELGYDKDHLIYLPLRGDSDQFYSTLKQELKKSDKIVNVTGTRHYPIWIGSNTSGVDWDGKDPDFEVLVSIGSVDFDYVETMKIELLEGRSFSKFFSTDTSNAFMINEVMMNIMGGQTVVNHRFDLGKEGIIVGVMKNFHYQSVENNIEPLALRVDPKNMNYIVIRLAAGNIHDAIDYVEKTWKHLVKNYPFEYSFVDQEIDDMYSNWDRVSSLLRYFAVLAIVIACLGLFGLASFMAEQRTKEIGVRKVLGASTGSLVILMSKDFTKWVLLANVIAWPVSYYTLDKWLENFAYRIDIGIESFVLAGVMALFIALLTVMYQSISAAKANPVDSIKYE